MSLFFSIISKTTFNEYGMCYTFNNYPQAMNQYLKNLPNEKHSNVDSKPIQNDFFSSFLNFRPLGCTEDPMDKKIPEIKKVNGCGKKSGLQLIIDSHKLQNLFSKKIRSKGYHVFITVPGVVTSKIPFYVDPEFDGEHNFYIHGIHSIGVSISTSKLKVNISSFIKSFESLSYLS